MPIWTAILFLLCALASEAQQFSNLPNPNCTYDGSRLSCGQNIDIPVNFDVLLTPTPTTTIRLVCPSAAGKPRPYCNVMREECDPIPVRTSVHTVSLNGFTGTGTLRPPIAKFLSNINHQITRLEIEFSRIGYLDKEFFRGFRSLNELLMAGNDIQSVSPTTFELLTYPLVPAPNVSVVPNLRDLRLHQNAIEELDWSVFRPVAAKLERIALFGQLISSVKLSGKSFRLTLEHLDMRQTFLTTIPKDVLATIVQKTSSTSTFLFERNQFCPSQGDCSCCELQEFMDWARDVIKSSVVRDNALRFSCGGWQSFWNQSSAFALDLHRHCPRPVTPNSASGNESCYEAPPIDVTCSGNGALRTSEPDLKRSDAFALRVSSDNGFRCRTFLYDIHTKILEIAGVDQPDRMRPETVTALCNGGNITVDTGNADTADINKLTFKSDSSPICREKFNYFVDFIYTRNFQQNLHNDILPPIVPVDRWVNEFQICSDAPPLTITCNATSILLPQTVISNNTTRLTFVTNQVFSCRRALNDIHKYLLAMNDTVAEGVESTPAPCHSHESHVPVGQPATDTLTAVCQKGRIVLSHGSPEQAAFATLEYYSAPNEMCRSSFQKFVNHLTAGLIGVNSPTA